MRKEYKEGTRVENYIYELTQIGGMTRSGIGVYEGHTMKEICYMNESNPLYCSEELRDVLIKKAKNQNTPVIYQGLYGICFGCIKKENQYVMVGPLALKRLNCVELHRFSKHYHIESEQEKDIHKYTIAQILSLIGLINKILTGEEITESEMMSKNQIEYESQNEVEQEQVKFSIQEDEADRYHHTYMEEKRLLDCVREGRVEEAIKKSMSIDVDMGKLSENEMNHWKNTVIVSITLCTRAAIEGGVSPIVAYQLSDFYIQKNEACKDIPAMIECRNRAIRDLTGQVKKKLEGTRTSSYVEQCKNYVNMHYKEKIYLDDIADILGISSTYLSKIFSKETGVRLQDYITSVRVEHSANLLLYSEESLSHIAEYVNFPTQSYFGNVFKKYKGMTPREFRERYKPKDFI